MNIRIENLSKKYGPQTAVDNISFEVKTGEILGFLYLNMLRYQTISTFADNYNRETEPAYIAELSNESGKILTLKAWNERNASWVLTSSLQNDVYFSSQDSSFIRDLFPGRKTFSKK